MNNKLLELKIAEIYQKYSLEKYTDSLGVYKELKDGSIRVGYIYKNKKGVWVNNLNDKRFHEFKPDEIVYSCFNEGYTPFHISDYVHCECWDETSLSYEDKSDILYHKYYHGQKAYFEYCRDNGIDANYMEKLTGRHYYGRNDADRLFWRNDKQLLSHITKVIKKNKSMEPTTLQRFEYMLSEPYYENITPLYTLDRNRGSITYFGYDDLNSIISLKNDDLPQMFDLQDWAFNSDEDLYKQLDEGATIVYMSIDTHDSFLYELAILRKSGFDKQTISGIEKYLTYINDSHAYPKLSKENQENYKKLVVEYKLSKIQLHQKSTKKKQEMER